MEPSPKLRLVFQFFGGDEIGTVLLDIDADAPFDPVNGAQDGPGEMGLLFLDGDGDPLVGEMKSIGDRSACGPQLLFL